MRHAPPLLVLALVLAGCSGASSGDPSAPAGTETSPADAAPSPSPAANPSPSAAPATPGTDGPTDDADVVGAELAGRWAHYDAVAYGDGTMKSLIASYGFNDLTVSDGRLVDTASFCFSDQVTDQDIEMSMADAATQAIKPPPTALEVEVVEGNLQLRRPPTPTPLGIRLDDPATESLPSDPADPRVVDDDGDGNPGVTVQIEVTEDIAGEVYLARREIFSYEVTQVEPDLLTGTVVDRSEQLVLGASSDMFATSGNDWVQDSDPSRSPIVLRRVDRDWTCNDLEAARDELFGPLPVIDW